MITPISLPTWSWEAGVSPLRRGRRTRRPRRCRRKDLPPPESTRGPGGAKLMSAEDTGAASRPARQSGRVVLLGAGHAHLDAIRHARSFTRRGFDLTVVAPGPFWYSGLATGMLGGEYAPEDDQIDV